MLPCDLSRAYSSGTTRGLRSVRDRLREAQVHPEPLNMAGVVLGFGVEQALHVCVCCGDAGRVHSPFRKAMLFVDNAGADAVLGMVPLARELLAMGADVVLVANSYPAINDITSQELAHVIDAFCVPMCAIIAAARAAATRRARAAPRTAAAEAAAAPGPRLQVCGSGAGGPCLDLRRVSAEVAAASRNVDLVVIEGMGRAVHTNFYARLTCPVLKLAMIKTERVAQRLFNGKLFDCMCRFDLPGEAEDAAA